jgi:hypothetical protein
MHAESATRNPMYCTVTDQSWKGGQLMWRQIFIEKNIEKTSSTQSVKTSMGSTKVGITVGHPWVVECQPLPQLPVLAKTCTTHSHKHGLGRVRVWVGRATSVECGYCMCMQVRVAWVINGNMCSRSGGRSSSVSDEQRTGTQKESKKLYTPLHTRSNGTLLCCGISLMHSKAKTGVGFWRARYLGLTGTLTPL